ncbi:hypothetical protein [Clostridium sp.]|uniref:hypothetical protein n=1 Tax=Clostridium sp. TaxID=1506 RepID=UPI0026036D45|nr:hypothetical protein [Clostridium sp.]
MYYNIERSQENDKDLGLLWEDIKIVDDDNNYIIFRKYEYNHKNKWTMYSGNILSTKFYNNEKYGFTKQGRGKIKKEVEEKQTNILNWTFENVKEITVNNIY